MAIAGSLEIGSLEIAQTHVLPEAGLSWSLPKANERLHLVGRRESLALVTLPVGNAVNPKLEAWLGEVQLGAVALARPSALPPTESQGPAFASNRYSATLPAGWMRPGLTLRAFADNYAAGAPRRPSIGADVPINLRILPFYLFGANEGNSVPMNLSSRPARTTANEIFAKWPAASVVAQTHAAIRIVWPQMVIGPRSGGPAYVVSNMSQQRDGYATMSAVLGILGKLREANGEAIDNTQYYAPLMMLDAQGVYRSPGGGLGGGNVGTGDHHYQGIFIHEQGHAMGLPHVGGAYKNGSYPYVGGSLAGSAWGYDSLRRQFLGPFVPTSASRYNGCTSHTFDGTPRQLDTLGRCVKQDPMQSGAGDQAQGYAYATFSDFSTAVFQRHLEGRTGTDSSGKHTYSGGAVIRDMAYPGGYRRWDGIDRRWVNVTPATTDKGLYGFDGGLPVQHDLPVYSILLTISRAGTPGVTQIYPPLAYFGNRIRYIDPTKAAERASIVPNTSSNPWYCHASGCDYTVRVTYADGSVRHVAIQGGFRPWWGPKTAPGANASNPLSGDSFRLFGVNVPADKPLRKIELLDTPMLWDGLPASPVVLASRQVSTATPVCVEPPTVAVPASAAPAPKCVRVVMGGCGCVPGTNCLPPQLPARLSAFRH
ncbi:M66 family metalloprotease [Montanilutibacter psychrotolerans]|nr:M66 family metalloprotease [Lysobacter psychrotolerans]